MNIAFACDANYAKRIGPIIRSILTHAKNPEDTYFYVLSCSITPTQIATLMRITPRIEFIAIDSRDFEKCPISKHCQHITLPTYYRFIIAEKLPALDQVLYLDCDVVISNQIDSLWSTDLGDCCAAVVDERDEAHQNEQRARLEIGASDRYFNAGVMLLNLKAWREQDIASELFENIGILGERIMWLDQDVLNYTLRGRTARLSEKYNYQHREIPDDISRGSDAYPSIIHYFGRDKPWDVRSDNELRHEYLAYLSTSERFFYRLNYLRRLLLDVEQGPGFFKLKLLNISLVQYRRKSVETATGLQGHVKLRLLGITVLRLSSKAR